jgi:phage minor structural protein
MGKRMQLNGLNPASEQSRLQLDHFAGLWDGPRILIGGWFWQRYIQSFNPLINTRDSDPFVYLSTSASGNPRMQVYDAGGSLLLDQYEPGLPWMQTTAPYYLGMVVSDDGTAQLFSAHSDGRHWTGPVRTFSGTPNFGASADVEVFSLRSAGYYESGFADEITVAQPSASFDLDQFVQDLARGTWANGQEADSDRPYYDRMDVTEAGIVYTGGTTYSTDLGAEPLAWTRQPVFTGLPGGSGTIHLSDDDGASWTTPDTIPDSFDGLVRWTVSIGHDRFDGIEVEIPALEVTPAAPDHDAAGNTVTITEQDGVIWSHSGTVTIPVGGSVTITASPADGYAFPAGAQTSWTFGFTYPDPPTLEPIADLDLVQGETAQIDLDWTITGEPDWSIATSSLVTITMDDGTLHIEAGFSIGETTVTITLTDQYGRSASQLFEISVAAQPWDVGAPPRYPHAPIVLWDDEQPAEVIINPLSAVITKEVNGAQDLNLVLPANHRAAYVLENERIIQVADERYRIRRVTTKREGGVPVLQVYAEAGFYDLATAKQIDGREWIQVAAGDVMAEALAGTGWTIGVASVSTLRTYTTEDTNPLELLREVQSQHGGDLLFDNNERTVSLVPRSGVDKGVSFFYGKGLTDSKRVVDTTSLVTRIYARNADGVTIASVNGGRDYVEDYSYTSELRTATYDFKSGTSPYTMLSMANATLANRSRPDVSYEVTVEDLSAITESDLDRFDAGDYVTVVDPAMNIAETQRVMRLEYDIVKPWASRITLSARLRELSSSDSTDAGVLTTGAMVSTFDLVPFNLLLNSRFDNGLAHWAHSGASIVDGDGTGDYAVQLAGGGTRWIEQTVQTDNRNAFAFSMDITSAGGPQGWVPDVTVEAEVTYEDGSTEIIEIDLE